MQLTKTCKTERELTAEERERVFYANENIRNMCLEKLRDSDNDYLDDILHELRGSKCNYEFGNGKGFLSVREGETQDILQRLLKIQNDYGFMKDETTEQIKFLLQEYDKVQEIEDGSEYYSAMDDFTSAVEDVCQEFAYQVDRTLNYNYTDEDLLEVFHDYEEDFTAGESEVLPYLD